MPPRSVGVNADGDRVPTTESSASEDDSFGEQLILKEQERRREFILSGAASFVYTSNVALAAEGPRDDGFGIVSAGLGWNRRLGQSLEANIGAGASLFRYVETTELDFQNLGFGAGLTWAPANARGISVFGRFDVSELFGGDGDQILLDLTLSGGAQKVFLLGRAHALTVGALGMLGFSDPSEAQRDQIGAFIGYRLQISRRVETDFLYRPAVHFYNQTGRTDFNHIVSWHLRYRFTENFEANAFLSYGGNRSERAVFDYDVLTSGFGLGASLRF